MDQLVPYPATVSHVPIRDYARIAGVDVRSVNRWLKNDELPGAYKDETGRWQIPADAVRNVQPRDTVARRPEAATPAVLTEPSPPTIAAALDQNPVWMPLSVAAPILGTTPYSIRRDPDFWEARKIGGVWKVSQATVRRMAGLT